MDIIIVGAKGHNRNDPKGVVYCGQSREDAQKAVDAARGYVKFYEVNSEPFRPWHRSSAPAPAKPPAAPGKS